MIKCRTIGEIDAILAGIGRVVVLTRSKKDRAQQFRRADAYLDMRLDLKRDEEILNGSERSIQDWVQTKSGAQ